MAIDYTSHSTILITLQKAQDAETDNREMVREAHHFLDKRDGQWEPESSSKMSGRLRLTLDKCNPIIDDIAGEMEQSDFGLRVRPSGGASTVDIAKTYDGLIRNIQSLSGAVDTYNDAGREMVSSGIAGWEVTHDFVDGDAFEQDLMIKAIPNYEDRVWFMLGGTERDQSDAPGVFLIDSLTPEAYDDEFPDGSKQSIGDDRCDEVYYNKSDDIKVGRVLYKKTVARELVMMSDGSVYVVDDEFRRVSDELAEQGITEDRRRKRKSTVIMSRMFDGGGWLTDAEETVFNRLPVIPTYGNFKIRESKIIYRGAIEKLIDAQRAYNMTRSREVEEVANSPVAKYWATRKQFDHPSDRAKARTLNTNTEPVQLFTNDPDNPGPPPFIGGAIINPGLQQATQNSLNDIQTSSSTFDPQATQTRGALSQVAIQSLENKGDNSSIKYFSAQKVAICATGRVLVDAIPKVYDSKRQVRILAEDGAEEMVTINDKVFDQQSQSTVELNNLSSGTYDVTCDVGPAFKNRQQESVSALTELIAAVPGVGELSADVLMKNISSPGVDVVAERVRRQLVSAGVIPESQLTDDEREEIQAAQQAAAQQPQEPSPQDKIAQAEIARVEAETADVQVKAALKQEELRIKEQQLLMDAQDKAERRDLEEMKLMMQQQQQQAASQQATIDATMRGQQAVIDALSTQASTLKTLREAMGVDAIVDPNATKAFAQQAEAIIDQQGDIDANA